MTLLVTLQRKAKFLEAKVIRNFAETARRYCQFVDRAESLDLGERLVTMRDLITELLAAAYALPDQNGETPDVDDDTKRPVQWPDFGDYEVYWKVFDPHQDEERVAGSLSDDALDIYMDLRRGLSAYDQGREASAVWHWRFHFEIHWGDHAVDALRALLRACRLHNSVC